MQKSPRTQSGHPLGNCVTDGDSVASSLPAWSQRTLKGLGVLGTGEWTLNCANTSICPINLLSQQHSSPAVKRSERQKLRTSAFLCLESSIPSPTHAWKLEKLPGLRRALPVCCARLALPADSDTQPCSWVTLTSRWPWYVGSAAPDCQGAVGRWRATCRRPVHFTAPHLPDSLTAQQGGTGLWVKLCTGAQWIISSNLCYLRNSTLWSSSKASSFWNSFA